MRGLGLETMALFNTQRYLWAVIPRLCARCKVVFGLQNPAFLYHLGTKPDVWSVDALLRTA